MRHASRPATRWSVERHRHLSLRQARCLLGSVRKHFHRRRLNSLISSPVPAVAVGEKESTWRSRFASALISLVSVCHGARGSSDSDLLVFGARLRRGVAARGGAAPNQYRKGQVRRALRPRATSLRSVARWSCCLSRISSLR